MRAMACPLLGYAIRTEPRRRGPRRRLYVRASHPGNRSTIGPQVGPPLLSVSRPVQDYANNCDTNVGL